jgi:LysM repeat protein
MVCLSLFQPGFIQSVWADEVQVRADHPERYVVQKGDTLWDISTKFLKSPWHWPRIWKVNEQIKNPHLIYPGDVIVFRYVDGKPELTLLRPEKVAPTPTGEVAPTADVAPLPTPAGETPDARPTDPRTTRLSPKVHSEAIQAAIPTIPPNAIVPFLTQPHVLTKSELNKAGYITIGLDNRIALGDGSEFYARGMKGASHEFYHIVRQGKPLVHPDTQETLAYEALYLGDARLLEPGDPSKLVVINVKQEIQPTDRLIPANKTAALPYYYPHAPQREVKGYIVSALNAVAEVGPYTVVTLSLGTREGMEEGHVLRVMRHVGKHLDPVTRNTYKLPDEESAIVMVFKTFDKVSYALVMSATRPVHILDAVRKP